MKRIAVLAALLALSVSPASAQTYDTFETRSEGCAGGGDVCGGFPLVPAGSASSTHQASPTGTISIAADVDGGIPALCAGATCAAPLARYHAEAMAEVWANVSTPPGAHAISFEAAYSLSELTQAAATTIGTASASLTGSIGGIAPDVACSDGSPIVAPAPEALSASSALGERSYSGVVGCDGGATLPAATWRVSLSFKALATTDGGSAQARARAALTSVEVTTS